MAKCAVVGLNNVCNCIFQLLGMVFDEEEQIQQAIAMSLVGAADAPAAAEQVPGAAPASAAAPVTVPVVTPAAAPAVRAAASMSSSSSSESAPVETPVAAPKPQASKSKEESGKSTAILPLDEIQPPDTSFVKDFFEREVLTCSMRLIEASPDLVYRVADLMSVIIKSSSSAWIQETIRNLCKDVSEVVS